MYDTTWKIIDRVVVHTLLHTAMVLGDIVGVLTIHYMER